MDETNTDETTKKPRGFAAISPERRREISSKGGHASQATGKAHRFTTEEASAAGKKGGVAPHRVRGRSITT
jgi:general stress protein YciG